MEPVETVENSVETVEKSKNQPSNEVGGVWYAKWVGLHLLAGAFAGGLQFLRINTLTTLSIFSGLLNILSLLGVFITIGAECYALPFPVRRDWLRWLAYSLVAQFIMLGVTWIAVMIPQAGMMSTSNFSLVFMVVNLVLTAVVGGAAGWLVLRRFVQGAAWWFLVIAVGSLFAATTRAVFNAVLYRLFTSEMSIIGAVYFVGTLVSTVAMSLITGAGLWWLIGWMYDGKPKNA